MRLRYLFLASFLLWLGGAAIVRANCAVIDTVDRLHSVQIRLARHADPLLFAADLRFIRAQINRLSDRTVLESVGSTVLSPRGVVMQRFLRDTRALVQSASMDDTSTVTRHFARRDVRATLRAVENLMTDLRCSADDIAEAEAAAGVTGDDDDAGEILREAMQEMLDPTNYIILGSAIIATIIATRIVRAHMARQRRRSKRYTSNYETVYRVGEREEYGRLIDISGKGTKLFHGLETPPPAKTDVDLMILGTWRRGTIMWSNANYSGILFKRTLKAQFVRQVHMSDSDNQAANEPAVA